MEHHTAGVRRSAEFGSIGDEPARFLRELRQLRYNSGLGHAELAARAHYPCDSITAAETGPALPDLPVLSAYVRGCGGTTEEWEERWRSLTSTPALPALPTRSAGCSAAAAAGARIGSVSPTADGPDPATILNALDRMATEMNATSTPATVTEAAATDKATVTTADPAAAQTTAGAGTRATESVTTAADTAGPTPTHNVPGPAPRIRGTTGSPAPSRTTMAALIVIAICVLIVLLAIYA